MNEDKTFNSRRYKNHPMGRNIPVIEIFHILLQLLEITTNLWFIQISILSFKVRAKKKIKLDRKGNIVRDDDDDDADEDYTADGHTCGIPVQRIREQKGCSIYQQLTVNQKLIY